MKQRGVKNENHLSEASHRELFKELEKEENPNGS